MAKILVVSVTAKTAPPVMALTGEYLESGDHGGKKVFARTGTTQPSVIFWSGEAWCFAEKPDKPPVACAATDTPEPPASGWALDAGWLSGSQSVPVKVSPKSMFSFSNGGKSGGGAASPVQIEKKARRCGCWNGLIKCLTDLSAKAAATAAAHHAVAKRHTSTYVEKLHSVKQNIKGAGGQAVQSFKASKSNAHAYITHPDNLKKGQELAKSLRQGLGTTHETLKRGATSAHGYITHPETKKKAKEFGDGCSYCWGKIGDNLLYCCLMGVHACLDGLLKVCGHADHPEGGKEEEGKKESNVLPPASS